MLKAMKATLIYILAMVSVMGIALKCALQKPVEIEDEVIQMTDIVTRSGGMDWWTLMPLVPAAPWPLDTPETGQIISTIDSCDLLDIPAPNFRGYYSAFRDGLADKVEVVWEPYRTTWIEGGVEQGNLFQMIADMVDIYIPNMGHIGIDKTGVEGDMMILDFNIYFLWPVGSWNPNGSIAHYLYLKWPGVKFVPALYPEKNLTLGSNSNDDQEITIQIINSLQSWKKFSLWGTTLDSIELEGVYDMLLFNCKCCATFHAKNLPMSQTYVDQFLYQDITLIQ